MRAKIQIVRIQKIGDEVLSLMQSPAQGSLLLDLDGRNNTLSVFNRIVKTASHPAKNNVLPSGSPNASLVAQICFLGSPP